MKFGWLSDSHLDTIQYGLERRREDFEKAFESAVTDMLARKLRVIIHSGDLINSNRPSPRTMKFLQVMHDRLRAAYAVMWVVSGNHDRTTPHWVDTLVGPDNYYGIQLLDFKKVAHRDSDNGNYDVTFYGLPCMAPEQFRKQEFPDVDVLVIHQMIREFVNYEQRTDVVCLADIPPKYKLVAVGDVHEHHIIEQPGRPGCLIGYPGSTEMKSETENGQKYWVDCEIDAAGTLTLLPVKLDTRPVLRVNLTRKDIQSAEIDMAIVHVLKWEDNNGAHLPGYREPMIFVTYHNTLTDVMPKFKTAFDPDKYILRFKPVFGVSTRTAAEIAGAVKTFEAGLVTDGLKDKIISYSANLPEPEETMTVEDILRSELSSKPELFGIASQLIKPDIDENAALDEFIDGRLRSITEETAIKNI